jgi:putative heme-binding domain-containing protein
MSFSPYTRRWWPQARAIVLAICILATGRPATARTEYPNIVEAPPLSPRGQLKTFHLPPGFEIQLVAADPDVHKPMNFNFDAAGRLWFTASVEYPYPKADNVKGRDWVRVIHGFNADGSATKITTFADDLNIPIGVTPIGANEAIVFSIPYIYRLRDRDGDGFAEKREIMFGPFGQRDTHGLNNGFTYGIDGWIYACHGYVNSSTVKGTDGKEIQLEGGNIYRFRPDGSHIEFFTHGQVNPFGLTFDPLGNLFSADCHTQPEYLLLRGASYPSFGKPHDGLRFGPPIMNHLHGSTAIAGIACYDADQFPKEYFRNMFVGNPVTHRVNRDSLVMHGSSFEAVEDPDFIVCDDPWFRPVEVKLGPDGALYIADFYNCIIGHYEVPLDHPKRDRDRGRIWRVVYTGGAKASDLPLTRPNLAGANGAALIKSLADPNIIVRTLATNELVNRIGASCIPLVNYQLNKNGSTPSQRAHGLWVLERLGALNDELVRQVLNDTDRMVRVHTIKALAERRTSKTSSQLPLTELVRIKLADDDAFVRRAAADCLGRHLETANLKPLLNLWQSTPADDDQLIHTIRMALRDHLKLPEVMAAVRNGGREFGLSDDQHKRLAKLCLGIPTTAAADVALNYLNDNPNAVTDLGDAIYPLMRNASEARLNDVYKLALSYRKRTTSQKKGDKKERLGQEQVLLLGLQRGAQERGVTLPDSIDGWAKDFTNKLLASGAGSVRLLGIELAQAMKLRDAHRRIAEIALTDIGSDVRIDAIMACVAIDGPASAEMLNSVLTDQKEELALRQRAARALGTVNTDAARASLLTFLPTAPERLAVEVSTSLAKSKPGGEALLAAIAAGKASPQLLQEPLVTTPLRQQKIDHLDEQIAKLIAGLPSRDEQIRRLIEDRLTSFSKFSPDIARGKQVFTKNCAICHKLGDEGAKIGPQLDGIGIRGAARVMEDVLDPNRNVDRSFRTTTLVTTNGLPMSGLLVREDGKVLVLIDSLGKEQRVSIDEIEPDTRHISALSPMPGNVRDLIPVEDFYHLIGYLLEQRPK